jgi:FAD synthase
MGFKQFISEEAAFSPEDIKDMKPVVISPGRFNPPHKGHALMIDKLVKLGKKHSATPVVIIVDSGKRDAKNPLDGDIRKKYLHDMFPQVHIVIAKNPYDAVEQMGKEKMVPIGGVTGSDRAKSYKSMVGRIFGDEVADRYEAEVLTRDPDADDVKGISATKVRDAAAAGDAAKVSAYTGLSAEEAAKLIKKMQEHLPKSK